MDLQAGWFAGMHNSPTQFEEHEVVINLTSGDMTK